MLRLLSKYLLLLEVVVLLMLLEVILLVLLLPPPLEMVLLLPPDPAIALQNNALARCRSFLGAIFLVEHCPHPRLLFAYDDDAHNDAQNKDTHGFSLGNELSRSILY